MKGAAMNRKELPVVVGVDGSPAAERALQYAAWEAQRRHAPLTLVFGYQTMAVYGPGLVYADTDVELRTWASGMISDAADRIRQSYPALVKVDHKFVAGSPAGVLIGESEHASLVVVGSRGRGGFAGLALGSVSSQVATHSAAPVVIVRYGTNPDGPFDGGPVLVGVDGSTGSQDALEFAFDQASARGVPLFAVYVWGQLPRGNLGPISNEFFDLSQAQAEAERMLAEALAGWSEKYPDVEVDRLATQSHNPARTLADLGVYAGLIVVGARGRGGFSALLMGSTADGVVRHAERSVAVVHPER
jgi:nucleotide-binding universal stress UspA family protein